MKRIIGLLFVLMGISTFAQTKNFTVSGKIKGLDSKFMHIYMKDDSAPRGYFSDSIPVKPNGSFTYSMNIRGMAYLTINPGLKEW